MKELPKGKEEREMPIKVIGKLATRKGEKDARRHREKQREAIKARLPEIIADEAIITEREGKKIKVPIKILDIPHFRPGKPKEGGGLGLGQGPGKPGDVIGRRPGLSKGGTGAGNIPGEDYIEAEFEIEELIELMLEDFGLPNLSKTKTRELEVLLGLKFRGIRRKGPRVLLEKRRTVKEGIKRFHHYLAYLVKKTGRSEVECAEALRRTQGILPEAEKLLSDPTFSTPAQEVEPFPIFEQRDLRYHEIEEKIKPESNAVVFAMMDVSGSMYDQKKYLAKSCFFWLVEVLRMLYQNVEVRFVTHETEAKVVPEEDFFRKGESGGTYCYTAFELASSLIRSKYPPSSWNIYGLLFSDGDDYSPERTVEEIQKLLSLGVNMVGYGEIGIDPSGKPLEREKVSGLLSEIRKAFDLEEKKKNGLLTLQGPKELPLLCVVIRDKKHIQPFLGEFLRKERWQDEA